MTANPTMPKFSVPLDPSEVGPTVKALSSYEIFLSEELRKVAIAKKCICEMCNHAMAKNGSCQCGHSWNTGDPF